LVKSYTALQTIRHFKHLGFNI